MYEAIRKGKNRKKEDWSFDDFKRDVDDGLLVVENWEDYFRNKISKD